MLAPRFPQTLGPQLQISASIPAAKQVFERKGIGVLNQVEQQEPTVGVAVTPTELRVRLEALQRENGQLREALTSRIVIEQAKGVLVERFRLDVDQAFELLRRSARSEQQRIHDLAAEIVDTRRSPARIEALAARSAHCNT